MKVFIEKDKTAEFRFDGGISLVCLSDMYEKMVSEQSEIGD